jgi:NTP pyrophosphatase (non-canonical NTP hydrolase)
MSEGKPTAQYSAEQRVNDAAEKAVRLWGREAQLRQLQEECCELGAAVNQFFRGRLTEEELAAEIADVLITVGQARRILGRTVDLIVLEKLERLELRIFEAQVRAVEELARAEQLGVVFIPKDEG